MKTFSIKASVRHGWALFKSHKKVLILSTLIWLLISSFDVNTDHWPTGVSILFFIISTALFFIGFLVQIGWYKVMLKVEAGDSPRLHELFAHKDIFWKYLLTSLLYGLAIGVGFLLLIVPGIYMLLKYGFAHILIVDKKHLSITEAFRESAKLTEGIKWKLFGFLWVMLLINIVGVLALGVGILVSIPVTTLAYIHIYRGLLKREG